jgi:hypothetical protein
MLTQHAAWPRIVKKSQPKPLLPPQSFPLLVSGAGGSVCPLCIIANPPSTPQTAHQSTSLKAVCCMFRCRQEHGATLPCVVYACVCMVDLWRYSTINITYNFTHLYLLHCVHPVLESVVPCVLCGCIRAVEVLEISNNKYTPLILFTFTYYIAWLQVRAGVWCDAVMCGVFVCSHHWTLGIPNYEFHLTFTFIIVASGCESCVVRCCHVWYVRVLPPLDFGDTEL